MSDKQAATFSTLPEVVPSEGRYYPGPELVPTPDPVSPEAIEKVAYGLGHRPEPLPPSYPIPVDASEKSKHRSRRKAIIIAAVITVLAIAGIVAGVVVSQTQKARSPSSTDAQRENEDSPPGTTPSPAQPDFGTPTNFPSSNQFLSACQGVICPQILASAQFSTPPTTFLFARGTDGAIWTRSISNGTWQTPDWISLGGSFLSQPTAASPRDGRVEVFGVWADDREMRQKTYSNGQWDSQWLIMGGKCLTPAAVCSVERNKMDVVLLATNHHVVHKGTRDGGVSWTPVEEDHWEDLGGWAASSPDIGCATNSKGERRVDVVIYGGLEGTIHSMFYRRWNSTGGWDADWNTDAWGDFKGDPVVVSEGDQVAYLGVGRRDGAMWYRGWTDAAGFGKEENLGGEFESVAAGFATGTSRLDVLAVGTNGSLRHKARVGNVWGEWEDLGGHFNSAPKVVRPAGMEGRVAVFGIGPGGAIIHAVFAVGDKHLWGSQQWYSDGGVMTAKGHRAGPA